MKRKHELPPPEYEISIEGLKMTSYHWKKNKTRMVSVKREWNYSPRPGCMVLTETATFKPLYEKKN